MKTYLLTLSILICFQGTSVPLKAAKTEPANHEISKNIDSLINIANIATDRNARIDALNAVAWELRLSNKDTAIYFANQALAMNKGDGYLEGKIKSYNTLGNVMFYKSKHKEALANLTTAFQISNEINDTVNIGKIANNLGTIYQMLGKFDKSVEYNLKALSIKEKLTDTVGIINSLINIASLYHQLNKFKEGIYYANRGYHLALSSQSPKLSSLLNALGTFYKETGDYQTSIKYLREALEINIQKNDEKGKGMNYQNLGVTYEAMRVFDSASHYYNKSLEIKKLHEDNKGIAKTNMALGIMLFRQGRSKPAINYLTEARDYFEQANQPFELRSIYDYLAKANASLHYFETAYNYLVISYDISDTIYSIESKKIIEELEEKYESDKKELQIQKQSILIEKKNAMLKLYVILAFITGAGTTLIFWLIRRKRRMTRKLVEKNLVIANKPVKPTINQTIEPDLQKEIYERLTKVMEEEKIYTDVDLTIEKLAKAIQTNRTYLTEIIRTYSRTTYPAYINEFRINHAIKLLNANGQKYSIDAIANESGFKSVSNFYKLFKETTGLTPIAFQKNNQIGH